MIHVRRVGTCWYWMGGGLMNIGYGTSAHALRDAWLWCGASTPALVFT